MSTEQKPMGLGKSIFHIAMFIFWVSLAIYFAYHIYDWFVHNAEVEKENEAARTEMYNIKANCEVTERNADGRPISWVCP